MGVVGNKCDLYNEETVKEETAKEWAKEIGAIFQLTSALTNTGIDELFNSIGEEILRKKNNNNKPNSETKNIRLPSTCFFNEQVVKKKKKCC